MLAAIAETSVMYAVTSLAVPLGLHWRAATVVPLASPWSGNTSSMLNDLVLLSVLFFSGAVLPLAEMPGWARTIGTPLFMTHAVAGLRTVMLDGRRLNLSGTGGLAWTLTTAAAWSPPA